MKHGAIASRLTPISFSRIAPSWTVGALSIDAVMTGSASRAASSTEVTLADAAPLGPPTVAMRTPSAAVTMLNRRTRSARARPASASLMCSASAIIAFELRNPLTMAFTPLAATDSRSLRDHRRVDRRDERDHDGAGGAVGPPGRHVGQHRPQVGRVGRPAAVDARGPHLHRRVVHPEHGGQFAGRAGGEVGVGAGDGEDEGRRGLRQAGGHGAPVPAAARVRSGRMVGWRTGNASLAAVAARAGRPAARSAPRPPPRRGHAAPAAEAAGAAAFGVPLGQVCW